MWLSKQKLEPLWHSHLAQQVSHIMLLPDILVYAFSNISLCPFHQTISTNTITWGLTSWVVHARGPANVRSFPLTFSLRKAISVSLAISCYSPMRNMLHRFHQRHTRRKWTTSALFKSPVCPCKPHALVHLFPTPIFPPEWGLHIDRWDPS